MNARASPSLHGANDVDPLASMVMDAGGIADLVFGDQTVGIDHDDNRPLAMLASETLELDLSDPVQRQFGDYELLEKIGEGGMGVVYRARQTSLEREVAVKLLAAGPWASRDFIERFRREAQNAARMQHPNIVAIYEVGSAEELHYFSMRLVHGGSLASLLKREGRIDPRRAAQLLRTIAEAVDYAHRLGVLHLDLKPANVLVDENGTPHVADFGLARRLEQGLVTNNEISGTPSYMAPEQATAGPQKITPATDIWGLGAIGYELVTGQAPYLGKTPHETLKLVVEGQLRNPRRYAPELPRDLEAIIRKCMAYGTAQRYASARDLAEDLTRFQNGYMVKARPLNTLQRSARWAQREPKIVVSALLALLALLIGLVATTAQWRRANANAQRAESERALATQTATVSSERLWDGRRDAALRLMHDGNGFAALAPLIANIEEKQAAGKPVEAERREIGMIETQGVVLIDRFIIPDANPMATALSPDGSLLAVTLNDLSVRWYDTATLTERGRLDLLNYMDPNQVPVLPRFIDDHRLLVIGEWFDFLPNPSTSGGVLVDLDHALAITPPKQFADLADITWSADVRHALLHDTHSRVQLWQVEPWRPLSALTPEFEMLGTLWVLDPKLRYAVQFGRNMSELRLFDPRHLGSSRTPPLPPHESFSAWAASHDGASLAVGTSNGQTYLIDMRHLAVRQVPGPLGSRVSWLSFSEDDAWLAAARSDGSAFAYDAASGEQLHAGQMRADFDATHVDIDHRSHLLVLSGQIAGGTGDAQIWRIPKQGPMLGEAKHLIANPPRDGRAGPYWLSAAPSTGLFASAGMNGEIRLWRLPNATVLDAVPPLLISDNLYSDGDHVVDVAHGRLRVVSTAQHTATPWLPLPPPIVFAQLVDGSKTLVAVARAELRVLDAATLKPRIPAIALDDTPQRMAVSADGRFAILSFDFDGRKSFEERIERYDLGNGKRTDSGNVTVAAPLRQFLLSKDASRLLTTGPAEGATAVFDANTLKSLFAYPHDPTQPVMGAAFTAGARQLWMMTRSTDDTQADNVDLTRVDLRSGRIVETRHVPGVYPVGIATVGDKPLLAGRDRVVLDPGAQDEHAVTGLRGGEATTIFAVSRDDRLLAHAFGDGVQLYSAADLTPIGPPLPTQGGPINSVSSLAFSDDGQHLLAMMDPPISSNWVQWPVSASRRSVDELRADAVLLDPHDAGPRVLAMTDAAERMRLRARDPGPLRAAEPRPTLAVARWIGADPIPARDPAASALQIDLGEVYNRAPRSSMNVMNTVMPAMNDVPFGLPRIDGVDYDLRGALEMRQDGGGLRVGAQYHFTPHQVVRGLRVPSLPIAAFHVLLFAPESIGESRERVYANVRLHYRDGSEAVLPLRTQREVKGWTDHDRPTPIGWSQGQIARSLGLMRQFVYNDPRLPNRHPDRIVETLDLETVPKDWSTPVFFAITAEPVIAGRNSRTIAKGTAGNDPARDDANP